MTELNVTQEMIDSPFADAVIASFAKKLVEDYYIFFPIEMFNLPEDGVENIIDGLNQRSE